MHETTIAILAVGIPLILCAVFIGAYLQDIYKRLGYILDAVRHTDLRKSYTDAGFHE